MDNGAIQHELLHALGFIHKQNYEDRDNHVTINWENIKDDMAYNFDKYPRGLVDRFETPYDFSSVMHYMRTVFTS